MPPKTQKLLDALEVWCDKERGRRAEIAKLIGIKRQSVTDWFSGRQQPTAEQILTIQELLAKQKKRKTR
jgi:DNA-binding transcriptional regulator YdaS (Cro superfamily)